ncbi:MAG TPA: hypothetical protein VL728_19125 [Cyclobacteriaceae bacterium]|jgi:hypothetical protein|nr:hypothetical protein [Cyclobacteriaceae bacterium]
MKNMFVVLYILGCSFIASGQYYKKTLNPDRNYRQHSKQMTIDLSPIVLSHGRYYYDGRHVSFDQLAMPLLAVKDSAVDRHLKSVFRTRLIGAGVQAAMGIAFTVVWLNGRNDPNNTNLFLGLFFGQLILGPVIKQLTVSPQRKAIDRYNEIILQPSAFAVPRYGIGLGLTAKF